ncbi:replication initiator protein A [Deinococcus ruber]|uniref:Plasmid replication initiator protein n=1 Tax=Deinococcus ruber TaxID=1848197 RepID=A0A918C6Z2_9DEIO|nr:replication initiator protein A [Deinococcus ruber]GGR09835.1 hypothetical protein GCM10008957_23250 [Deinococcus ruber]
MVTGIPVKGHDERNLSELIFIPPQERLPKAMLTVHREFVSARGQPISMVCEGTPSLGLAHGLDNDVLVALINLYITAGAPADGMIRTTLYALMEVINMPKTAYYYRAVHAGLQRLQRTSYSITTPGWYDAGEQIYVTSHFSILNTVNTSHVKTGVDHRSLLQIMINDRITENIRNGYVKPLDLRLYGQLPTLGSRTLYRHLDSYLHAEKARGSAPYVVSMPLMSLAENLGYLDKRSDNLRRTFDALHPPLIASGYLQETAYSGRGAATTVHYVFGKQPEVNGDHLQLLRQYGVHDAVAERYARELNDNVPQIVERFLAQKARRTNRVKDDAAYLVSLLQNASSVLASSKREEVEQLHQQQASKKQAKVEARQQQVPLLSTTLNDLAPEAAAEKIFNRFRRRLFVTRGLTVSELDQLALLVSTGHVLPDEMEKSVMRATSTAAQGGDAMALLRNYLNS